MRLAEVSVTLGEGQWTIVIISVFSSHAKCYAECRVGFGHEQAIAENGATKGKQGEDIGRAPCQFSIAQSVA
jgi:hypothetical protein